MFKISALFIVGLTAAVGIITSLADARDQGSVNVTSAEPQAADALRVASALGLGRAETATLAEAQARGQRATACLLAHGATQSVGGAVVDEVGGATDACGDAIARNEAFLASPKFGAVLEAARPRLEAAAQCFSNSSGIAPGTVIDPDDLTSGLLRRIEAALSQCFRADGLPR